jgi:sulfite exporter TauE/SafE
MITFGIAGLLLAAYGLWIKNEKIQDIIYIIGGIFLLTYSIYIDDPVFIVLQVVFIFSALFELIKLSKK